MHRTEGTARNSRCKDTRFFRVVNSHRPSQDVSTGCILHHLIFLYLNKNRQMKLNRIKISDEIFFTLMWEQGGKLYGCDRHEESHISLVARWDKGIAKIYINDFMNGRLHDVIEFLKEKIGGLSVVYIFMNGLSCPKTQGFSGL